MVLGLSLDFLVRWFAALLFEIFNAGELTEFRPTPQFKSHDRRVNYEVDIDSNQRKYIDYVCNANLVNPGLLKHTHSVPHRDIVELD